MTADPTWDFQNPASKDRALGVLQREIDELFEPAAESAHWLIMVSQYPAGQTRERVTDMR